MYHGESDCLILCGDLGLVGAPPDTFCRGCVKAGPQHKNNLDLFGRLVEECVGHEYIHLLVIDGLCLGLCLLNGGELGLKLDHLDEGEHGLGLELLDELGLNLGLLGQLSLGFCLGQVLEGIVEQVVKQVINQVIEQVVEQVVENVLELGCPGEGERGLDLELL